MKYLHLIWSNLKRKKLRTMLTLLSILVAFVLFGFLASINQAFKLGIDIAGADRLVVRHSVSLIQLLPESYEKRIEKIPGVLDAAHATWFGGYYQELKNQFFQAPVVPDEYLSMYPELVLSQQEREAFRTTRTGAVAGRTTAEKFGWKVGDRIPIQATLWVQEGGNRTWEFDLVGIYDAREKGVDKSMFLFRYDYFDEARAFMKGMVGWYMIKVADPDRAAEIAALVDEEFANSPYETKTETEKAFVQAFAKQIGNIGAITTAIMSAVFFTILLVAGNTMAQAVRERIEELAVMKALGFTNRQLLGIVLAESCLLALVGGGIGLSLGWMLISRGDPTGGFLPAFYFARKDLLLGVGLVLLLGLSCGILPALQAMRLKIADAMRRN